jgi:hypothetical protein
VKYLELEKIQTGMVITSDIKTAAGTLLLPAGTEITTRHLQILKGSGIKGAHVGFKVMETEIEHNPGAALRDMHLQDLFCHHDPEHPFIKELMRLYCVRLPYVHRGMKDDH